MLKEEEKYDHLLNSIQAQTLIRTVDKVNLGGAVNNTQDNLEEVDTAGFTGSEVGSFVKSQCDIMEEASRYIENAKVEYDSVTDYYEDIQRIENAPENIKLKLCMRQTVLTICRLTGVFLNHRRTSFPTKCTV